VKGKQRVYDPQKPIMTALKWQFAKQMRDKGYLKLSEGAIFVFLSIHKSLPKSWSQKRAIAADGAFVETKPDADNYQKIYLDILSGIAYRDDAQIARILFEKRYSAKPRIEIEILQLGDYMINEHAKTVQENINIEDLDYMIKKANKLGTSGRKISRVFAEEDSEGRHVYFEVDGLRFNQKLK